MKKEDKKERMAGKLLSDEGKDILCNRFRYRMFGKIKVVNDDKRTNLLEFKCKECAKAVNRQFSRPEGTEYEVFHYYDLKGDYMESELKLKKIDVKKEV